MKLRALASSAYIIGFVLFLLVLGYFLLSDTRRVSGTSMLPTLEEGDLVIIQGAAVSDIHFGDIVVYNGLCSATGESVIHRVVAIEASGLITKGDNNPQADQSGSFHIATGPITQDCLVGRVVYVIPYIERLASLPDGANYVLAVLIFLVVIYLELRGRGNKTDGEAKPQERQGSQDGSVPKAEGGQISVLRAPRLR